MTTALPKSAKLTIASILIGSAFGWAFGNSSHLTVGAFNITMVNVAMIALPILYLLHERGRTWQLVWLFTGGLALSGAVCHAVGLAGLNMANCQGLGLALVGAWIILSVISLFYHSFDHPQHSLPGNGVEALAIILLTAFIIFFYRLSHFIKIDIPNEDRSLFISGVEVHHINMGMAALLFAILIPPTWRWLRIVVLAYGAGSIIDQSGYYLMSEVTDPSYSYPLSWMGAGVALVAFSSLVLVFYFRIEQRNYE